MRTIRVAESRDREPLQSVTPRPRGRRRDALATAPVLLLVPALVLPILSTQANSASDASGELADDACVVIDRARFDPPGRDVTRLNREAVVLENSCDRTIDLDGWVVQDRNGENTYRFRGRRIGAGATMTLHTGSGPDHPGHAYWERRREVWDNADWERAVLKTPDGRVVSRWPDVVADLPITVAARQPRPTPNDPNPNRGSNGATPEPTATPSPTPTPAPTATASSAPTFALTPAAPAVAPVSTQGPSPTPLATPTPGATPTPAASCPSNLQGAIDATPTGGNLNVTGCTFIGSVTINRPMTIIGPTISRPASGAWQHYIAWVASDDVSLIGWNVTGGSMGIAVSGRDRVRVADSRFRNLYGSALIVWGDGRGSDDVVLERNDIVQSLGYHVSPIMSRGSENACDGGIYNRRLVVRGNSMDQGKTPTGWFGIELKCTPDALIEGNELRNGEVLVSLPESPRAIIRNNTFHTGNGVYWSIEIPNADDVQVYGNTARNANSSGNYGSLATIITGSDRAIVRNNTVDRLYWLVQWSGADNAVTDNCGTWQTPRQDHYGGTLTGHTWERNGPCT